MKTLMSNFELIVEWKSHQQLVQHKSYILSTSWTTFCPALCLTHKKMHDSSPCKFGCYHHFFPVLSLWVHPHIIKVSLAPSLPWMLFMWQKVPDFPCLDNFSVCVLEWGSLGTRLPISTVLVSIFWNHCDVMSTGLWIRGHACDVTYY